MERMRNPVKAYLSRYTSPQAKCRALEIAIESLRERAESITIAMNPDKVQSSPKIHDPIAEAAAAIADNERLYAQYTAESMQVLREITEIIQRVSDDRLQTLLILRYVDGLTWEAIADEMAYEVRQIYRLHGTALQMMRDVIDCQ